jgi:predicted acetyltransferase
MTAELVPPSMRHARSYVAALREGFRRGAQDRASERRIGQIEADFARYIQAITDQTGSIRLPTGEIVPKVPFSVLWLVEGEAFIGETHVRHRLNDYLIKEGGHVGYGIRPARRRQGYGKLILALALEECRRVGLCRVLVTCLEDNVASA